MRSCSDRTTSFAPVVMMQHVPSGGNPSALHTSHKPANANSPPPLSRMWYGVFVFAHSNYDACAECRRHRTAKRQKFGSDVPSSALSTTAPGFSASATKSSAFI
jgi:hypothetical protein